MQNTNEPKGNHFFLPTIIKNIFPAKIILTRFALGKPYVS